MSSISNRALVLVTLDATFWLVCALFSLVLLGFAAAYTLYRRLPSLIGPLVAKAVVSWAIERTEQVVDGKVTNVYQPTPAVKQLMSAVLPILVAEAFQWAKDNIKLRPGTALGGGGGGGIGLEGALGMLPKEYRGIASLLLPYAQPMIAKFLGGGGTPAADKTKKETPNPFTKDLIHE